MNNLNLYEEITCPAEEEDNKRGDDDLFKKVGKLSIPNAWIVLERISQKFERLEAEIEVLKKERIE
jgi:hypothetical protein